MGGKCELREEERDVFGEAGGVVRCLVYGGITALDAYIFYLHVFCFGELACDRERCPDRMLTTEVRWCRASIDFFFFAI